MLKPNPDRVRIYTSLYPAVVSAIKPAVEKQVAAAMPGVRVDWVQGGSSYLRRQLDGELAKGESAADLLLTTDPSHYVALKEAGRLLPYESPQAARLPADTKEPEHLWTVARYSVMVIGVAAGREKPRSFADLAERPGLDVSIGDPDFSGTNLVTVARLSKRHGWEFYEKLKARKVVVAGSNSTVMERLETGTTDAGIVLLENVLAARAKGSKVSVVQPADGGIVVPGLLALLPHAKKSRGAKAAYDAILSPEVQAILVEKGWMHSADPALAPPAGAPKLEKILGAAPLASIFEPIDSVEVKAHFAKLFTREMVAPASVPPPSPTASPAPASP